MPPDESRRDANEGRDQRLRVDAEKVDMARLRLAAIDRTVFGAGTHHTTDSHDGLIRQLVGRLFGHG